MVAVSTAAKLILPDAAAQDDRASIAEMTFSINYLTTFGYLAKFAWDNKDEIVKAVKDFQRYFGAKIDGVVGPKTLSAMELPRCGCPDYIQPDDPNQADYIAMMQYVKNNLNRWGKSGLKYYIKSYVGGSLTQTTQRDIISGAWKAWNDVCGLQVEQTKSTKSADLIIDTGEGRRSNFDGPGGTLAWAYLPQGDDQQLLMRFDLGETWINNPRERGILMFNVGCHEFGHMIGLDHSKKSGALMAPYYNQQIATPQWDDDIPRAQARYGKNVGQPAPTPTPIPPSGDGVMFNVKCRDLQVEGYTLFANG